MKWPDLPNPSEPANSSRRVEAVLRVYKHIEESKEVSEEDKAEFLHCIYVFSNRWLINNSASSIEVLERAGYRLFSNS